MLRIPSNEKHLRPLFQPDRLAGKHRHWIFRRCRRLPSFLQRVQRARERQYFHLSKRRSQSQPAPSALDAEASWETADLLSHDLHLVWQDYGNYWTYSGIGHMALGIAVAAPLATLAPTCPFAIGTRVMCERAGKIDMLTMSSCGRVYLCTAGLLLHCAWWEGASSLDSLISDDGSWVSEVGGVTNEWGQRCIRAMAVGTPMVGLSKFGLARLGGLGSSYWNRSILATASAGTLCRAPFVP